LIDGVTPPQMHNPVDDIFESLRLKNKDFFLFSDKS
jgi:hypothetical protein